MVKWAILHIFVSDDHKKNLIILIAPIMKEKIGTNAGIIWTLLDAEGSKSLKEIKKVCKLTEKDMYAALGWLAREGKIAFNELKDDLQVVLL